MVYSPGLLKDKRKPISIFISRVQRYSEGFGFCTSTHPTQAGTKKLVAVGGNEVLFLVHWFSFTERFARVEGAAKRGI